MRGRSEKRTVGNEGGGRRERREKETLPRSDKKVNWRRDKARLLRGCGPRRRATLISLVGPLHDRAEKSYEERRCAWIADKNGIFRIDSPFNPIHGKIPRRSLKKREATMYVTYARAVHGSQSSLRGFVLFYAPQLEADRSDPLSAQVPKLIDAFLRSNIGKNFEFRAATEFLCFPIHHRVDQPVSHVIIVTKEQLQLFHDRRLRISNVSPFR